MTTSENISVEKISKDILVWNDQNKTANMFLNTTGRNKSNLLVKGGEHQRYRDSVSDTNKTGHCKIMKCLME